LRDPRFATLVGAIDAELGGDGIAARAKSRSDEQWRALLALADWHRVGSVLARQLDPSATPRWVQERLGEGLLRDTARSLLFDKARADVLAALAGASIPVIPLKGSALVETIYPDATWRDMGDVDLLVERSRHAEAVAVVSELGYAPLPGSAPAGDTRHDPKLVSADGVVPIEIHRHVLDTVDARFDVDEIWARAQPSAAGTHQLAAPHDLLIHVCVHFVGARVIRSEGALAQIRDVAWIAARGDVDWSQLVAVSRRFGVSDRVRLALAVTDRLGLLPESAALPPLTRRDETQTERFAAVRVLTDRAYVPIGNWRANRSGLGSFMWWSRMHLSDVPPGELPDAAVPLHEALIDRWTGLRRGTRVLIASPVTAIRDVRVGRWMRTLQ
jgi:hypothetical protein